MTKAQLEFENEDLKQNLLLERKDNQHWREHAQASLEELHICQREKMQLQSRIENIHTRICELAQKPDTTGLINEACRHLQYSEDFSSVVCAILTSYEDYCAFLRKELEIFKRYSGPAPIILDGELAAQWIKNNPHA
jgi:hypothetical protein